MSDMPYDVYKKYSIRSELSLFVEFKETVEKFSRCQKCLHTCLHGDTWNERDTTEKTSNLSIEYKTWCFTYSPSSNRLTMSMHTSDSSETIAELIFWYWNDKKEIAILQKSVHTFNAGSSVVRVSTNGSIPVNKKFNVIIHVLEERSATDNNSLESYFGDYEGIETVTLCIAGNEDEEAVQMVVPKVDLMRSSPVFRRMFINEMTEKATNKVEVKDTNPEEFGDFLKAISPKQEHPNPSNVMDLLKLADRYQIQSLRDRCEAHLVNCVELPLLELLTCANSYGLEKLKAKLMTSFGEIGLLDLVRQVKLNLKHDLLNELVKMI